MLYHKHNRFNSSGNARIRRYWPNILFFLEITNTFAYFLNPIQDGGGGKKAPLY